MRETSPGWSHSAVPRCSSALTCSSALSSSPAPWGSHQRGAFLLSQLIHVHTFSCYGNDSLGNTHIFLFLDSLKHRLFVEELLFCLVEEILILVGQGLMRKYYFNVYFSNLLWCFLLTRCLLPVSFSLYCYFLLKRVLKSIIFIPLENISPTIYVVVVQWCILIAFSLWVSFYVPKEFLSLKDLRV